MMGPGKSRDVKHWVAWHKKMAGPGLGRIMDARVCPTLVCRAIGLPLRQAPWQKPSQPIDTFPQSVIVRLQIVFLCGWTDTSEMSHQSAGMMVVKHPSERFCEGI